MKRIVTIMAIGLAPLFAASAQNDVDFATRLGGNHYYGTARTLGMGNAVTAVGGDIGSIGINPAGSAVFNYGQVEFSPGMSFSKSATRFTLPSVGFSLCFNTGRISGLRNVTFSVVNNVSNNYLEYFAGENRNNVTSFFGNMAAEALGISPVEMGSNYAYDNPNLDWAMISSYRAYMLGTVPDADRSYIGGNELLAKDEEGHAYHYVPGELRQRSQVKRSGTKNDMVLNLGFNVNDKLYFGVNLGIPIIRYQYNEVYSESALDPEQFPISFKKSDGSEFLANFSSAQYSYAYSSTTVGVYGKAGVLWRPLDFMRIGAAVQTPVAYGISEGYSNAVTSVFLSSKEGDVRGNASSPSGSYDYNFSGPWRFNAGLAFTLGTWGLISADYEMAAFGRTRYRERSTFSNDDYFATSNEALGLFLGNSHAMRLGAEVRPLPGFSIRAGYTLTGTPERIWTDNEGRLVDVRAWYADLDAFKSGMRTLNSSRNAGKYDWSVSFGLGWASRGSFFIDGAVRYNAFSSYSYYPYLYGDYVAVDKDNNPIPDATSPRMSVNRTLWDVVVTLGWRF